MDNTEAAILDFPGNPGLLVANIARDAARQQLLLVLAEDAPNLRILAAALREFGQGENAEFLEVVAGRVEAVVSFR